MTIWYLMTAESLGIKGKNIAKRSTIFWRVLSECAKAGHHHIFKSNDSTHNTTGKRVPETLRVGIDLEEDIKWTPKPPRRPSLLARNSPLPKGSWCCVFVERKPAVEECRKGESIPPCTHNETRPPVLKCQLRVYKEHVHHNFIISIQEIWKRVQQPGFWSGGARNRKVVREVYYNQCIKTKL